MPPHFEDHMKPWPLHLALILLGCHGTFGMAQSKAEPAHIEVVQPLRHQVFQRRFDVPQLSHPHHPGGPAKGFAEVDCVLMLEHNLHLKKYVLKVKSEKYWIILKYINKKFIRKKI